MTHGMCASRMKCVRDAMTDLTGLNAILYFEITAGLYNGHNNCLDLHTKLNLICRNFYKHNRKQDVKSSNHTRKNKQVERNFQQIGLQ